MPGYSRSFSSFAQAADESGESRVVGGIHFFFDNTTGLQVGRELGAYIVQNFLLPTGDPPGGGAAQTAPGHGTDLIGAPPTNLLSSGFSGFALSWQGVDVAEQGPTLPLQTATVNGGLASIRALLVGREITRHQPLMPKAQTRAFDLLFGSLELTGREEPLLL
jgi:hypothetical protein